MAETFKTFEKLAASRQRWLETTRENEFEEGITNLLIELYPDNAHFIYELLQNAEDAEAGTVRFILSKDQLVFEHDGDRLFSLADVVSITSIGTSTKSDDATAIGKFGVGFKAVFAYTDRPEIHSGEFHFRIHDLVVPTKDGVKQKFLGAGLTRFLFPLLNHPTKAREDAVDEIEEGLQNLEATTLLFLNNIHRIEYTLSDGKRGWLERNEHDNGHIEIHSIVFLEDGLVEDVRITHWLRFQKSVQVQDEDGTQKTCRIAVAFSLQQQEGKQGETKWEIVPLERGRVCIYFPAEKETSNLRFHMHAPFASTVARDSVRNCASNHTLFANLAVLILESLVAIREMGLLNVNFLAVLPNPADNLSPVYEVIRKVIVEGFKGMDLTPTKSGQHAQATALYRGPASIAEVIKDEDLSLLTGDDPPLWVANPPQRHQREDRFLDSLEINEWGWDELSVIFESLDIDENKIEKWIAGKSDAELMRLYALFGEALIAQNKHISVYIRLVRIYGDYHVLPRDAYFIPDENFILSDEFHFVKSEVYNKGRSDQQKEYARAFLEHIGVQVYGEKTEIIKILNTYQDRQNNITKKHISDIK